MQVPTSLKAKKIILFMVFIILFIVLKIFNEMIMTLQTFYFAFQAGDWKVPVCICQEKASTPKPVPGLGPQSQGMLVGVDQPDHTQLPG